MHWEEIKALDPKKISSWPRSIQLGLLILFAVVIWTGAYFWVWQDQWAQIEVEQNKTDELKGIFLEKKKLAINLPAYKKQLNDIELQFGALLRQLPGKSEMDALLSDINQAGISRGLQFELFKPANTEILQAFYAELPITLRLTGNYHDIGGFAEDIGKLSRIVTLNDIYLINVSSGKDRIVFEANAVTYRYLDEAEIVLRRKQEALAKAKAKGKGS